MSSKVHLEAYKALIEAMSAILGIGLEPGQDYDSRYAANYQPAWQLSPFYIPCKPVPEAFR